MKLSNKNLKLIICSTALMFCLCMVFSMHGMASANSSETTLKPIQSVTTVTSPATTAVQLPYTNPLTIAANPTKYLNKRVRIKAKFDKFSVLGLDYKPAFKSSEKYITFLIKRDDVINNVVPLSEMKNFLPRKTAEKYIDLKPGDIVEYTGTVFSDALSDTWIDVDSFKVISTKTTPKK